MIMRAHKLLLLRFINPNIREVKDFTKKVGFFPLKMNTQKGKEIMKRVLFPS